MYTRLAFALVLCAPLSAAPVISEFCASNQHGLTDEDGSHSDWLEIHNPDPAPAVLTGWYLTDTAANRTKWRFPATTIAPGGYLVVFASSKDRAVAGAQLHTNFALSASGEYLGLIQPDGTTVVSEYAPAFPAQVTDISYGIPSNTTTTTLVAANADCQWIIPASPASPAATWKNVVFTPSGWNSATAGIGYDRNTSGVNYLPFIGTGGNTDSAMTAAKNPSCYVRFPFTLPAGTVASGLKFRARYDDGYAVWLNGQPLVSNSLPLKRNAPSTLAWDSSATSTHDDPLAAVFEDVDVTGNVPNLVTGANVLAIQSLNAGYTSSDHLLQVELTADVVAPGPAPAPGYFASPTPGARNPGIDGLVIPQEVVFSRNSGTFPGTASVTLSGNAAGQVIRYTLDGSVPVVGSPAYSGAFSLTATTLLRARIFDSTTGAAGFISARHYERLAADVALYNSTGQPFQSALPVVVLDDRGAGEPGNDNLYRDTRVQIFDRAPSGYSSLGAAPALALNAGVKLRGRSSAGFPKKSYGIEFRDESGGGRDTPLLGMPASEDWALVGGWDFDRNFMRNAWIYEVSRQAGRWAPRTRLVEVYFNQDGDDLEFADYRGVYILCESIRVAPDRVDVAKLDTADIAPPDVTGGYIFKVDSAESDEFSWRTTRSLPPTNDGASLVIHRPKLASLATAQSAYLKGYFQQFEDAVFTDAAGGFATRNYRNYIDSTAWADHNLFCTLAKNVDALRLSAYFSKDRGEKMAAGPLWDFDRSANSTDSRDDAFNTWKGTSDATDYHNYAWWGQLFQDVEFRQLYVDRWQALRRGSLSTANVNAVLDGYLAEFKPADSDNPAKRDYARWYGSATSNNITTETNAMKTWLSNRGAWIDSQFTTPPVITGTTISIPPGTTVYYTTDGTDPRLEGGGVSPSAIQCAGGAVSVPATLRLLARAFRSGNYAIPATNWSGPAEALFLMNETYATAADLRVSAVNYHPLAPVAAESAAIPGISASDFEWIELKNVSAAPVNLDGLLLPLDFPVSAVTLPPFTLAPGARAVIAKNGAAFLLRYGAAAAARIVATWPGYRSLGDGGARVTLLAKSAATIADFEYDDEDDWPARADGGGSSLEYIGTGTDYGNPLAWKSSVAVHGRPGLGETLRTGVVVNEIFAAPDAIELFNPGAVPVDLSGWFFSNTPGADTEADYRQFQIPTGTILAPGGHAVFNPSASLTLDGARGGTVWLVSADSATGKLLAFEQKEDYDPTLPGVSNGRFPDGSGAIVPLGAVTLGTANSAPRIGTVQASEIHYHPATGTPEFVEISNTGSLPEPLDRWTLRGDVDFDFPAGFVLAPAESVLMVPFDSAGATAAAFRTQYGVKPGVRLLGPWIDGLSDTAGTVRLRRRVPPPDGDPEFVGLMLEDEVNYLAAAPWPAGASGTGASIQRLGIFRQASDPASWIARAPTAGAGSGYAAWIADNFVLPAAGGATLDPDGDTLPNLVEYFLGTDPSAPTPLAAILDPSGGEPRLVLDYTLRLDRDDGSLVSQQSTDLDTWTPAANDELLTTDGFLQHRRAWLPVGDHGFLRLRAAGK